MDEAFLYCPVHKCWIRREAYLRTNGEGYCPLDTDAPCRKRWKKEWDDGNVEDNGLIPILGNGALAL